MGIVKISLELHEEAKVRAKAMSRSVNSQIEHWARIGRMAEDHPELSYPEICQLLLDRAMAEERGEHCDKSA